MDSCIVIYLSSFNPFWSLYFLMLSCPACGHMGPLPVSCVSLDKSQDGPSSRGHPTPAAQAPKKDQCKSGLWSRGGEHACEKLISRQSPVLLHELEGAPATLFLLEVIMLALSPSISPLSLFNQL